MRNVKVFESGSGKWLKVDDSSPGVLYTSDCDAATVFNDRLLRDAHSYFADFSIYKQTLFAVPAGSNRRPWECETVTAYLDAVKANESLSGD